MSLAQAVKHELCSACSLGIEVIFGERDTVRFEDEEVDCSGYFSAQNRLLAVAIGLPPDVWVPVFLHEMSHAAQWAEKSAEWTAVVGNGKIDLCDEFFGWLAGKRTRSDPLKAAQAVALLELDAEIRTFDKLIKYKLHSMAKNYVQKANSYCLFYVWAHKNRSWYSPETRPYMHESVWSKAPKKFDKNSLMKWNLPIGFERALNNLMEKA